MKEKVLGLLDELSGEEWLVLFVVLLLCCFEEEELNC